MSRATLDRHKRCIVAVSEGVSTADGKALVESLVPPEKLERDAHGNVKLSGSDLPAALERALAEGLPGKRARVDALGYMPRGYVGAINAVDAQEAFDAGAFAVAVAEQGGGSVALQYDGRKTVLKKVPLKNVAGKTRHMPDDFMLPDVNQLSEPAWPISSGWCRRNTRSGSRSSESRPAYSAASGSSRPAARAIACTLLAPAVSSGSSLALGLISRRNSWAVPFAASSISV